MKNLLTFLTILLFISSCKNDKVKPKSLNEIGNLWTYHYYEGDTTQPEIMTVEITGDTLMDNGDPARVWKFTLPDRTFYRMVKVTSSDFEMYRNLSEYHDMIIPLSLKKSDGWRGSYCEDTSTVVDKANYTLGECEFKNAWNIERSAGVCFNWVMKQNIWWHPKWGILRLETNSYNFGLGGPVIWELVDVN